MFDATSSASTQYVLSCSWCLDASYDDDDDDDDDEDDDDDDGLHSEGSNVTCLAVEPGLGHISTGGEANDERGMMRCFAMCAVSSSSMELSRSIADLLSLAVDGA